MIQTKVTECERNCWWVKFTNRDHAMEFSFDNEDDAIEFSDMVENKVIDTICEVIKK